jgi:hypothetical protein
MAIWLTVAAPANPVRMDLRVIRFWVVALQLMERLPFFKDGMVCLILLEMIL